ncbi:GNAT family N-acetyltransferase [Phenylobacterium immobile]|uniref:GNAT family N-acetyltransferase n=1 Tax=Phenylobacterium immobile TaxID=21 RepID=UPI000A82A577|nr:GNAT family N-acetyltransferase [Phenylobacterium immobile]
MNFQTLRLSARPLSADDLDDLVALHLDAEVSRFLGGVRSAAVTAEYLATNLQHWDDHGFGLWVLRDHAGRFAGRAGVRWTALEGVAEVEIAYAFHRAFWGRGLATEVAQALVGLWRDGGFSASLVGIASAENGASRGVLTKAGLVYERDAGFHGEPVVVYRLGRP